MDELYDALEDISDSLAGIEYELTEFKENENATGDLLADRLSKIEKALTENQKSYIALIDLRLLQLEKAINTLTLAIVEGEDFKKHARI